MPPNIVSLPPDILITICKPLPSLSLLLTPGLNPQLIDTQTCRVLHALGSTDYVWHQINIDLSLDLDATGPLADLPANEIKNAVIRALRLNENWNKRVSKLFRITRALPRNAVVEMQPLGRHWLVTSHRSRGASINLSVWRLDTDSSPDIGTTCIIAFQPINAFSFHAAFREGQDSALISVLGGSSLSAHKGQWTIYDLNLNGHRSVASSSGESFLSKELCIEHSGVPYYSQISGSIAAVAIVHVGPGSYSHQIVLLNTKTNVILKIDSPTITNFDCGRFQFKLYLPYIVIIGTLLEKIKVHVRKLPSKIFSETVIPQSFAEDTIPIVKWDAHIADFETGKISNLEFCIPNEPVYPGASLSSITVMVDHSPFSTMENGTVEVFRFPIDVSKRDLQFINWQPTYTFSTQANVSLEPVCLGKTGTRAVWLSHQWNSDEYQLMKGYFPKAGQGEAPLPLVVPLQPPDSPLPFQSRACRSLAFEEATGRLFVGVHTGEIYVLEYNKE